MPSSSFWPISPERAIVRAQGWLDRHITDFTLLPHCEDEKGFEARFKPFVEVALVCFLLTRERHERARRTWYRWARTTADRLFDHLEWEGLMESFRVHPTGTLGLAAYPFLEHATGRRSSFHWEAAAMVDEAFAEAQERTPMREMDYHFTRHLFGHGGTVPIAEQVAQTILKRVTDPLLMDTDALYDVTHVVFYATQFEIRPDALTDPVHSWLADNLGVMALARFLLGDADLGAELLLARTYLGLPPTPLVETCVSRLLASCEPSGAFRGPTADDDNGSEFERNYHTTLVAMVTLAEWELSRCGTGSTAPED